LLSLLIFSKIQNRKFLTSLSKKNKNSEYLKILILKDSRNRIPLILLIINPVYMVLMVIRLLTTPVPIHLVFMAHSIIHQISKRRRLTISL